MWDLLVNGILDIFDDVSVRARADGNALLVHARSLIALAMIIFYSFRSYGIITGDEQLNITKLMRPFAILFVILLWPNFVSLIDAPIAAMEGSSKASALANISQVRTLSERRKTLSEQMFRTMLAEATTMEQQVEEMNEPGGFYDRTKQNLEDFFTGQALIDFQERFAKIIRGVHGLVTAKIQYYFTWGITWLYQTLAGILVLLIFYLRVLISGLLFLIGPFSFAISIFPAFEDSWKQWTSRYIGVQLYGLLGYVAVSAGTYLLQAVIQADINYYEGILNSGVTDDLMAAFLADNVGNTTTAYVIGLVVFGFSMFSVPLVAGWFTSQASAGALGTKAIKTATEAAKKTAEAATKLATAAAGAL